MRMRGQAFVTLDHPAKAAKAIREIQRLPLYGKAMVRHGASTHADRPAIVFREDRVGRIRQADTA